MSDINLLFISSKKSAVTQTFDEFGLLHSFNDEPSQILKNGNTRWTVHGVVHRDGDKPAQIITQKKTKVESYYINGILHRDGDKPAKVQIHETKNIVMAEGFYKEGNLYRSKTYDELGNLVKDSYQFTNSYGIVNGRLGYNVFENAEPTTITYYPTGEIKTKEWWFNGKLCRFDGPAKISFTLEGEECNHIWTIHDRVSSLDKETVDKLLKLKALGL